MLMSDLPVTQQRAPSFPSGVQVARVFAINLGIWSLLSAVGAGSAASQGNAARYLEIFCDAWLGSLMQAVVGTALYAVLWRRPALIDRTRSVIVLYAATWLLFAPFDIMYRIGWPNLATMRAATIDSVAAALHTLPRFECFVDFVLLSCTFAVQIAICNWRQGQSRQRALATAENENLRLHLELEQLRMLGLRAQFEPHFMFNALNAISALVRGDDRKTALAGINRLSALLRYALTASAREWVSIGEELAFVRDYLALQQLRYGERLHIRIDVGDDAMLAVPCPPLLLQPLVENALRHDLDCHAEPSDIHLQFTRIESALIIAISNPLAGNAKGQTRGSVPGGDATAPVAAHAGANPGLGLGLHHTEASLQFAFGAEASLRTHARDGRFVVELRLPLSP